MAAPRASLLQSRSSAASESAPEPLATYAAAAAWWRCLVDLNLCNFAPRRVRGSPAAECGSAPPPASPRDFGLAAPGVAAGVWREGETAAAFADPYYP